MKKLIVILIIVPLLALIGYTAFIYVQAHEMTGSVSVINNAQAQAKQNYIPRIPIPTQFPEQPESPMPAAAAAYAGTWVVTNEVVGHEEFPAPMAQTYGVGKTIIIEPNYFNNNSEMYPQSMKNPHYSIMYPSAEGLSVSFPYKGGGAMGAIYPGIETLVVNAHGITTNPAPRYNFADLYLDGGSIIVNSNGYLFRCVRQVKK